MNRVRRRRSFRHLSALAVVAISAVARADAPGLERALSWVPEDAVSFVVIPDLKHLNDDLVQLIDGTGQGGVLAMGRPIDLLKAQLGVGANLDDKGSLALYYPAAAPVAAGAAPAPLTLPVVVVPVTDADAFLAANLKPAPEQGEGAYTTASGVTFFVRKLEGRVALAPSKESLPHEGPMRGISERFRARLKADEMPWLDRADVVAWGSRDALHAAVERARVTPMPEAADNAAVPGAAAFAGTAEQREAFRKKSLDIADMLADGVVVLDVDPLGIFVATIGVAEPSSALAAVTAGGEGRPAKFDRIPQKDFYLALAADIDGLGGAAKFGELVDLAGVPRTTLPDWFFAEGTDLRGLQFAAYPSKLGVAIGGALNDSSLFVASRDPARTMARIKQSIESLAGETAGIRREPSWNTEKKLKSGEVVTAFEVKETIVDASKRPPLDYERLIKQFIVGSRGLNGLAKQLGDGVVVTFSQRPDVYGRALEAAAGTKSLAGDDTVQSIEAWLPPSRDVEAMVGIGRIVQLATQIASSFVSEAQLKSMIPEIEADAPPIGASIEIGGGRVRSVFVVPVQVIKMMTQAANAARKQQQQGVGGEPAPAAEKAP